MMNNDRRHSRTVEDSPWPRDKPEATRDDEPRSPAFEDRVLVKFGVEYLTVVEEKDDTGSGSGRGKEEQKSDVQNGATQERIEV
ncbi:hypothetical protein HYFRA_00008266 [Hymenoscyphus fraxineus]|uniref:Uncharacterized protein n=1 Tax=Hymenoscyphus fraxineus TaxID=746836 RepID=A0A9N9PUR5_9HELO|nr:hypothetical protein HYFRA_00008266 [Hymenoscyphus fraxineus]